MLLSVNAPLKGHQGSLTKVVHASTLILDLTEQNLKDLTLLQLVLFMPLQQSIKAGSGIAVEAFNLPSLETAKV